MVDSRFHRQELLFGADGQARLAALKVTIVGLGGLGSHVAQQLAYLGVGSYVLIDRDRVDRSNLNRLIGATPEDAEQKRLKVEVAQRMILHIEPTAQVSIIASSFITPEGFSSLSTADVVIGCVDRHGARFVLNEVCAAHQRQYLDIATDLIPDQHVYGGHVVYVHGGDGCLYCLDVLDQAEVDDDLGTEAQRQERARIYGVPRAVLRGTGPSVVSLNGVLASLAVTELMREVTKLGRAHSHLEYRGDLGTVRVDRTVPPADCYYCKALQGQGDRADVQRYLRQGLGDRL